MFTRVILSSLSLVAALSALTAHAEPRAGVLTDVRGTVLVSNKEGMAAGYNGQQLASGARLVATSGSRAMIAYDSGCHIPMGENTRAVIRSGASCAQLQSEVTQLAQAPGPLGGSSYYGREAAAQAAMERAVPFVIIGGTSARLFHEIVKDYTSHTPVSPN